MYFPRSNTLFHVLKILLAFSFPKTYFINFLCIFYNLICKLYIMITSNPNTLFDSPDNPVIMPFSLEDEKSVSGCIKTKNWIIISPQANIYCQYIFSMRQASRSTIPSMMGIWLKWRLQLSPLWELSIKFISPFTSTILDCLYFQYCSIFLQCLVSFHFFLNFTLSPERSF